jgi:hypothetical protein
MSYDEMEGSTFLEDFLSATELLPNDIRRDFELIRELDRDSKQHMTELTEAEKNCNRVFKKKRSDGLALNMDVDDDFIALKDKRNRIRQKQEEKVAVASNMLGTVEKFVKKLESDLLIFETQLRGAGSFEQGGAEPGQEVSIRPDVYSKDWILGRVVHYYNDTGYYDIADVDDSKRYHLPETQVIVLDLADSTRKLSKGEEVLAVYPDTTAFYPATIAAAPRRGAMSTEPSVMVQFTDDADATGETQMRTIPLKHVVRPPH